MNDMCFFHLNERDLNSLVEYRRRTGEEMIAGGSFQPESDSFATYSAQAPYMFLDHSQILNYRNTNCSEGRSVFSSIEELHKAPSERN